MCFVVKMMRQEPGIADVEGTGWSLQPELTWLACVRGFAANCLSAVWELGFIAVTERCGHDAQQGVQIGRRGRPVWDTPFNIGHPNPASLRDDAVKYCCKALPCKNCSLRPTLTE